MEDTFESLLTEWRNLKKKLPLNLSLDEMNQIFVEKYGILSFFSSITDFANMDSYIEECYPKDSKIRDFGDFQTPLPLTDLICQKLCAFGVNPEIIIEPTAGKGNFVVSAIKYFPKVKFVIAIDIQSKYEWLFKLNFLRNLKTFSNKPSVLFIKANIFEFNFNHYLSLHSNLSPTSSILILGNPPWVTNTELSKLQSSNIPTKSNFKNRRGLLALTGESNFDLAEVIIANMISVFSEKNFSLAMLCKISVIKNLLRDACDYNFPALAYSCFKIDAKREFNASVDAGLLFCTKNNNTTNNNAKSPVVCEMTSLYSSSAKKVKFGYVGDYFVSNIDDYQENKFLEGNFPLEWRQGIKHDATKVFTLSKKDDIFINGYNEQVLIEPERVFPLIKSSDIKRKSISSVRKYVIITQNYLNEPTSEIQAKFPQLWGYLISHKERLKSRKSRIYLNSPMFAIFGIGEYAFAPYKVAISGFYKDPVFALLTPLNNKSVMLDDTCYYISFQQYDRALLYWTLLNSKEVTRYLRSLIFTNSKRPYTKKILKRINMKNLVNYYSLDAFSRLFSKNCPNCNEKLLYQAQQAYSSELELLNS